MSDKLDPVWVCTHVDVKNNEVTFTNIIDTSRPCHCRNLLAGHDEWCPYHKPDYTDPRTRTDLWGIKRQDTKTRAEINAESMSLTDRFGSKAAYFFKTFNYTTKFYR